MRTLVPVVLIVICSAFSAQSPSRVSSSASSQPACAPLGTAYMRTTLYFGLTHKKGTVSDAQWRTFLREDVTPRFPNGLTVWEADGQWRRPDGRIGEERAKVLLLVHDETPRVRAALGELVARYKQAFDQESVLWESAPVCAAF